MDLEDVLSKRLEMASQALRDAKPTDDGDLYLEALVHATLAMVAQLGILNRTLKERL